MKVLSFYDTCDARSTKVISSKRIKFRFRTKRFIFTFPLGCQNLLELSIYQSLDNDCPSSGKPNGISVLSENSNVDYVVGEGSQKILNHEVEVPEAGSYIKIYADNDDFYDHAIDVQVEIEPF